MSRFSAQPMYLDTAAGAVFAVFHAAPVGMAPDRAVVLCPPFGWDEVCAYRSLRAWAGWLAGAGIPVLRVSLPSTADSGGGVRDPGRLEAWTGAVRASAEWLLETGQAARVTAVGLELGGLIAYRAASCGAPIDDLVLWATPSRGRSLIRQLNALSALEQTYAGSHEPEPPALPTGEIEAGGFLLSAETVGDLQGLDLLSLPLPGAQSRRVMLLGRDELSPDQRLADHLREAGVRLSVAAGGGYSQMTSHPQTTQPAWGAITHIHTWLTEGAKPADRPPPPSEPVSAGMTSWGDGSYSERIVTIEQPFGRLSGVLVTPDSKEDHGLCLVMLNAGAIRRIGPNRIWVESSRRWAQDGVPTLRLDLEGIGEADGDEAPYVNDREFYVERHIPQVLAALDWAQAQGCGERFLLTGLCSGAYWAFHAALRDARVQCVFMINLRVLVWDEGLAPARDFRAFWARPLSATRIRRAMRSQRRLRALLTWTLRAALDRLRTLRGAQARAGGPRDTPDGLLEALCSSSARARFLFSATEPLPLELQRSGAMARLEACPNVSIEYIAVPDHTLRPGWAQRLLHQALDGAVRAELRGGADGAGDGDGGDGGDDGGGDDGGGVRADDGAGGDAAHVHVAAEGAAGARHETRGRPAWPREQPESSG